MIFQILESHVTQDYRVLPFQSLQPTLDPLEPKLSILRSVPRLLSPQHHRPAGDYRENPFSHFWLSDCEKFVFQASEDC